MLFAEASVAPEGGVVGRVAIARERRKGWAEGTGRWLEWQEDTEGARSSRPRARARAVTRGWFRLQKVHGLRVRGRGEQE